MSEWQPIETAPKDGTVILLALHAVGALKDPTERRVYEGRWNELQKRFTSVNGFIVLDAASHWMPLPSPPSPTPLGMALLHHPECSWHSTVAPDPPVCDCGYAPPTRVKP